MRNAVFSLASRLTTIALIAPLSCVILLYSVRVTLLKDMTPTAPCISFTAVEVPQGSRSSDSLVLMSQLDFSVASSAKALAARPS